MTTMQIMPIDATTDAMADFVELPWHIYPGRHPWIPPLRLSVMRELSPSGPFFSHGEAQPFLAVVDGAPVGRIVAAVDRDLAERDVGYFGYFECIDDDRVAAALLAAAEAWLAARGRTRVWGPIDLNVHHRYRLLTYGFDTPPFLGEPRNPEYYLRLMHAAGYTPERRWNSWDIPAAAARRLYDAAQDRLSRHQQAGSAEAFHIEPFDPAHTERDLARLHDLFARGFAANFAITGIDLAEFTSIYGGLMPLLGQGMVLLFVVDGDHDVGFAYAYGDIGGALREMDGDGTRLDALVRCKPDTLVLHTFTILQEYRKSGAAHLLTVEALRRALGGGYDACIGALATEGRTMYDRLGPATRSYAVYGKRLSTPTPPARPSPGTHRG